MSINMQEDDEEIEMSDNQVDDSPERRGSEYDPSSSEYDPSSSDVANGPATSTMNLTNSSIIPNATNSSPSAMLFDSSTVPLLPAGIINRVIPETVKPSTGSPSWDDDLDNLIAESKILAGDFEIQLNPFPQAAQDSPMEDSVSDTVQSTPSTNLPPLQSSRKRKAEEAPDSNSPGSSNLASRRTRAPRTRNPSSLTAPAVNPRAFVGSSSGVDCLRGRPPVPAFNSGPLRPAVPLFHESSSNSSKRVMRSVPETDDHDQLTTIGALRRVHKQELAVAKSNVSWQGEIIDMYKEKVKKLGEECKEAQLERDTEQMEKETIQSQRDEAEQASRENNAEVIRLQQVSASLKIDLEGQAESLEDSEDLRAQMLLQKEGSDNLLEQTYSQQYENLREEGRKQIEGLKAQIRQVQRSLDAEEGSHNFTKEQLTRTRNRLSDDVRRLQDEVDSEKDSHKSSKELLDQTQGRLEADIETKNTTISTLRKEIATRGDTVFRLNGDIVARDRTIARLEGSRIEPENSLTTEANYQNVANTEVTELRRLLETETELKDQTMRELTDLHRYSSTQLYEKDEALAQANRQLQLAVQQARTEIYQELQGMWNSQVQIVQNPVTAQSGSQNDNGETVRQFDVELERVRREVAASTRGELESLTAIAIQVATQDLDEAVSSLRREKDQLTQQVSQVTSEKELCESSNTKLVTELKVIYSKLESIDTSGKASPSVQPESVKDVMVEEILPAQGPSASETRLRKERDDLKEALKEALKDKTSEICRSKGVSEPVAVIELDEASPRELEEEPVPVQPSSSRSASEKPPFREVAFEGSALQPRDDESLEVSYSKLLARERQYLVDASKRELASVTLEKQKAKIQTLQKKNAEQNKLFKVSSDEIKQLKGNERNNLQRIADLEKQNTEYKSAVRPTKNVHATSEPPNNHEGRNKGKGRAEDSNAVCRGVTPASQRQIGSGKIPTDNGDDGDDNNSADRGKTHCKTSNLPCQRCVKYRQLQKAAKGKYLDIVKKQLKLTDESFKDSIDPQDEWAFDGMPHEEEDCGGNLESKNGGCAHHRGRVQTFQALRDLALARVRDLERFSSSSVPGIDREETRAELLQISQASGNSHAECLKCVKYHLRIDYAQRDIKNCLLAVKTSKEDFFEAMTDKFGDDISPVGISPVDISPIEEDDCLYCQGLRTEKIRQDKIVQLCLEFANSIRDPNTPRLTKHFLKEAKAVDETKLKIDIILANFTESKLRQDLVDGIMVLIRNPWSEESKKVVADASTQFGHQDGKVALGGEPQATMADADAEAELDLEKSFTDVAIQTELLYSDTAIQTELIYPDAAIQTEMVYSDAAMQTKVVCSEVQTKVVYADAAVQTELAHSDEMEAKRVSALAEVDNKAPVELASQVPSIVAADLDKCTVKPASQPTATAVKIPRASRQKKSMHDLPRSSAENQLITNQAARDIVEAVAADPSLLITQPFLNSRQPQRLAEHNWRSLLREFLLSCLLIFGICLGAAGIFVNVWEAIWPSTTIIPRTFPPPRPFIHGYIPDINGPTCDTILDFNGFSSSVSLLNNAPTCDNVHISRDEWPKFPSYVQLPPPTCCLYCKPSVSTYTFPRYIRDLIRHGPYYTHFDSNTKIAAWVIKGGAVYGGYRQRGVVTGPVRAAWTQTHQHRAMVVERMRRSIS